MKCSNCGAFVTDVDLFCGECGQPLPGDDPGVEPADTVEDLDEILGKLEPDLPVTPSTAEKGPLRSQPPFHKNGLHLREASPRPRGSSRSEVRPGDGAPSRYTLPYTTVETSFPARGLVLAGVALLLLALGVAGVLLGREGSERGSGADLGDLVYEEGFDDPAGGWDVYVEDYHRAGYVEGEYRLGVYRDNRVIWGNPLDGVQFADFVVEVDARQVAGPLDNNLGLLVRYQAGGEDFYWFQVSSDGYYSVDLLLADEWVTLVSWEPSEAINQGHGATNRLKVVCDGDRFSFYVNDDHLVDVTDGTFRTGTIGLAAGTLDEPGVVVHFDNLKVYDLQE